MRKYLLTLLLLVLVFWIPKTAEAQLTAGDIAFVGIQTDDPDGFEFICLREIPAGQVIYFTDPVWRNTNVFSAPGEGCITFTFPGTPTPAGTIVSVSITNGTVAGFAATSTLAGAMMVHTNDATVGTGTFLLAVAGDQVLAFTGSPSAPNFIAAIHTHRNVWSTDAADANTSALPLGLTNGVNAVAVGQAAADWDNAQLILPGTPPGNGSKADWLNYINNNANWNTSNTPYATTVHTNSGGALYVCVVNANAPGFTNATCRGGNGTININNPTGASTYQYTINAPSSSSTMGATWHSSASFTPGAGTYHVWIRDQANPTCEKFLGTVTITQPAAMSTPTITSQTNIDCHGASNGQATISTPTGGVLPEVYFYDWPTGADTQTRNDLAAGTYVVTVIACSGNQQTVTVNITEPAAVNVTLAGLTEPSCAVLTDGAININVTGGNTTGTYTYAWTGPNGFNATTQNISGLVVGTYTVTAYASGCASTVSASLTVNLTYPASYSPNPASFNVSNISNTSATVSWTAVPGVAYYQIRYRRTIDANWTNYVNTTNNFINLTALTASTTYLYQVKGVFNNGSTACSGEFVPSSPNSFTTLASNPGVCTIPSNLMASNVTATTADVSWSTSFGVCYLLQYGQSSVSQSLWPEIAIAHPGTNFMLTGLTPNRSYRVRIRANCTTCLNPSNFGARTNYSPLVTFVTPATRLADNTATASLSVYPNPSQGSFNVKFASEAGTVVTLRLLDLKGTVVYESTHSATDGENILPVVIEHYTRGIYALQIQHGTQVTTTRVSLD